MSLVKDEILLENLRRSLDFYQQSIVWSMTAAAACFLLTLTLRNPKNPPIEVLYGKVSVSLAWGIAFAITIVLGIVASSATANVERILARMSVDGDIREAILLYPSFATNSNRLVRIGTALFPPLLTLAAFEMELINEIPLGGSRRPIPSTVEDWFGTLLMFIIVLGPYGAIIGRLRRNFVPHGGSHSIWSVIRTILGDPAKAREGWPIPRSGTDRVKDDGNGLARDHTGGVGVEGNGDDRGPAI